MITLVRDGKVMKVETELQVSAFLACGYKRVEQAPGEGADAVKRNPVKGAGAAAGEDTVVSEAAPEPAAAKQPKRRRGLKKQ